MYLFRLNLPYIVLTITLFLFFCIPFTMHGLSSDGRLYACFALDIANHLSTVWQPLSSVWSVSSIFHEHPPLSFYTHSLFIQLFGEGVFVDKFYFFLMGLLSLFLVTLFWRKRHPQLQHTFLWIPILSWLLTVGTFHPAWEGNIEATLVVFTTTASLFILNACVTSDLSKRFAFLLLGSIFIIAGFLTKGIQALFPVTIPIIYSLTIPSSFILKKGIQSSLLTTFLAVSLFALIVFFYPVILENIIAYFQQQIVGTFKGAYGVNIHVPRFIHIFWLIFKNQILIIALTLFMYKIIKRESISFTNIAWFKNILLKLRDYPWVCFFLLLALVSSVPVAISPRQSSRYIAQSFPFWALFFAEILTPLFQVHIAAIDLQSTKYKRFIRISFACLAGVVLLGFCCFGGIFRTNKLIKDTLLLQQVLPRSSIISINKQVDERLIHLLYRYHHVRVSFEPNHRYYVQRKDETHVPSSEYKPVELPFESISLFKK
ncbi:hypothetical protein OQJ13_11850 [Legionella sp. PATHC035]|uniref:ArnT family glycosyltransferase n=1 Tax=Legionella sp. PATHC035 TaxID=2992040 RepID=UPI0022433572|nr:hypothetical protein [Legionella sp. PATHC035]MCW8409665.1 hypothetical protein [Legionella sp. PATHC035]